MNKIKKFVKKFKKNVDKNEELVLFVENLGERYNAYISGDEGVIEKLDIESSDYDKFVSHLEMNQIDFVVR